jgi:hypothetical protein
VRFPDVKYVDVEVKTFSKRIPAPLTWAGFYIKNEYNLKFSIASDYQSDYELLMKEINKNRYIRQQQQNIIGMIGRGRIFRYLNPLLADTEKEKCRKL